jgi:hypothetical protein
MTRKDLVVLTADKNWMAALNGLFSRPQALGIRPIEAETIPHPRKDPGCANEGVAFLSNFSEQYHYGLLIFDYEGCGKEKTDSPRELQDYLDGQLTQSRWGDRARTIVLSPELEAWVWSVSPHVNAVTGWNNRQPCLRRWLIERGWLRDGEVKPERAKDAFQAALREVGTKRSSSLYQQIAERVSLRQCADASFLEFKDILRNWFPV